MGLPQGKFFQDPRHLLLRGRPARDRALGTHHQLRRQERRRVVEGTLPKCSCYEGSTSATCDQEIGVLCWGEVPGAGTEVLEGGFWGSQWG